MKKQIIILIALMFLVLPTIAAQPYEINERINLKFPFEVDGAIPSASASCNVSVNYPNTSYMVEDVVTTNLGNGEFNYTIPLNKVTQIGLHPWTAFCCDGVKCAAGYGEFEVTPTGFIGTLGFFFILLIISFGLIILGLYIQDAPITILGSFGLYFFALYILYYGIIGIKDVVYTWGIGLIVLAVAMYISTKSAYELITNSE